MKKEPRLPSAKVLLVTLVLFVIVMFSFIVLLELPIHLALLAVWFVVMGVGIYLGYDYNHLEKGILRGINEGMGATLILVSVGALIGAWIAGGVVPTMIYYGLTVMSPGFFLAAAMIICSITALATGTSFGAAGTAGLAMIAIGESFGIPIAMVAGAVISGCYLGDKMSPLSDTTIMTATLAKVDLFQHIKSMAFVSVPAFILTVVSFWIAGIFVTDSSGDLTVANETMQNLQNTFEISWIMLIPAAIVVIMLLFKLPSVPVIIFGAVLGVAWAAFFQGYGYVEAIMTMYSGSGVDTGIQFIDELLNRGGITFMLEVILLIILALGVGGLLQSIGVFKVVASIFSRWANSTRSLSFTTFFATNFGVIFGGATYVSLLTGTKITEENYRKTGISRTLMSRNVEAGGTLIGPTVPWTGDAVYMAATLGVATFAYVPFFWYAMFTIFLTLLYGYFGWFVLEKDDYEKAMDKEYEENHKDESLDTK